MSSAAHVFETGVDLLELAWLWSQRHAKHVLETQVYLIAAEEGAEMA